MKIGILTYHRSQNYGAQLQAYALQSYIKSIGYEYVYMIDYWPEYHQKLYKTKYFNKKKFINYNLIKKITYIIRCIILNILSYIRRFNTRKFAYKFFDLLEYNNKERYDVVIYGSDQIWRKQHQPDCSSYNSVYFGDNSILSRIKISYAASMGKLEINSNEDIDFLATKLKNFNHISVREIQLRDFINNNLQINVEHVCDPVFLLSKEQWKNFARNKYKKEKYIFVYNIAQINKIDEIASYISDKLKMPIIEYKGYIDKLNLFTNKRCTCDAQDFLIRILNADFIVTSSFHGVALSLKLEKEFIFASTEYLKNRTTSLLEQFNLSNRDYSNVQEIDINLGETIDYSIVSKNVNEYSKQSSSWLNNIIEQYKK